MPTVLFGATDLVRYDRTIILADWGALLGGPEWYGEDVLIPGMTGEIDGGRVAAARSTSVTIELTGMSAASTWPADPTAQFYTNLTTLKALVTTEDTLTVQPLGISCAYRLDGSLDVSMQADFWAEVSIPLRLQEGTL